MLARRYARPEAAALDRQRKRALHFIAGAHAARTDDAQVRIEIEIGIAGVLRDAALACAAVRIARTLDAEFGSGVLQFAVTIGRAFVAIERMIGDIEFDHAAPQFLQPLRLGADFHAGHRFGCAGSRESFSSLDFHQAQAAGSERLQVIGSAELRDMTAGKRRGAHDGRSGRDRDRRAVDLKRHRLGRCSGRRSEIIVVNGIHISFRWSVA